MQPADRVVDLVTVARAVGRAGADEPVPVPAGTRAAAVLVPLFEEAGETRVIVTRRTDTLPSHRSEIAFPGGGVGAGEDEADAAVREAYEEIGLPPAGVSVIGRLDRLVTPTSGFAVTPFVGVLDGRPELRLGAEEVDEAFDIPFSFLLDPSIYREERWDQPLPDRAVHFFELGGDTLWGVTGRIVHRLLELVAGELTGQPRSPG